MKTQFALQSLDVPSIDGVRFRFWMDGNSKVTVGNGNFEHPVANCFSLVHIQDCPYATDTCKSKCYVHKLEAAEAEVYAKYRENSATIRQILGNDRHVADVAYAFAKYAERHCPYGFRWHVSGDVFSQEYALFIRLVCRLAPAVPFWIYTRSFQYVDVLTQAENLTVNLSADADNYRQAIATAVRHPVDRICYMTVDGEVPYDLPLGSVIFPDHGLRGRDLPKATDAPWWQSLSPRSRQMVCPADAFGQSEHLRCGPCKKCLRSVSQT